MDNNAQTNTPLAPMSQRIIDYALEIIATNGFDKLTMRRLAAKMGTSAPNIYNYYASKNELYSAIRVRAFEILANAFTETYRKHNDPELRLRAIIEAYLNVGISHKHYYETIYNRPLTYQAGGSEFYRQNLNREHEIAKKLPQQAHQVLKEVAEQKGSDLSDEALRLKTIQMWSLLHGMIQLHNTESLNNLSGNDLADFNALIDDFINNL